ncbi:ABC transporter permease [Halovivax limisalsi]|uniref:ABC transporter permease n=1 Tax=Halovivax limisalsi TaxID=1453760 RepID=UPI001FFCB2AC|nr:ABC transporter permease [Halovivax limisalsi]
MERTDTDDRPADQGRSSTRDDGPRPDSVRADGGAHAAETGAETVRGTAASATAVWANQARAFAERCLRELATSRIMLASLVGTAAGMQLFFGALWEGMAASTIASAAVGTATFGAIYVCLYAFGYLLAGDLEARRYEAYRSMPIAASADLAGRMLAGGVLATVAFSLTLVAGVVTGGSFALRSVASVPIVLLAFAVTCVFWMLVALPVIATAANERLAEYGVPMIAVLGYMLTGFNGANVALSPLSGDLLNYLPNTLSTRLLIYHLVPTSDWAEAGLGPPGPPAGPEYLALLVAYAVVAAVAGTVATNRLLYDRGVRR